MAALVKEAEARAPAIMWPYPRNLNIFQVLPKSYRETVYSLTLPEPVVFRINSLIAPIEVLKQPDATRPFKIPASLMLANKQVHQEVATLFYGDHTFEFAHPFALGRLTGSLGLLNTSLIRYVSVRLSDFYDMKLSVQQLMPNLRILNLYPGRAWLSRFNAFRAKHQDYRLASVLRGVLAQERQTFEFGLKDLADYVDAWEGDLTIIIGFGVLRLYIKKGNWTVHR